MAQSIAELFAAHPCAITLVFVDFDDQEPFGYCNDGRWLRIFDEGSFARQLANLPGAGTEAGHLLEGGYRVKGSYNGMHDGHKAFVYRS